ncbi:response regulator receiver protein [Microbulbifer epialgicus]|uniref:Response regulator receiver protein n=1 Tax=Microbulbifer epialgicus TaxID=393907 RepID=A0ABV4P671_9GAMM
MFRLKVLIISILFSLPAIAEDTWHNSTVSDIYPLSDGSFVIIFNEDSPSCSTSTKPHQYLVKVGQNSVTQEGLNLMFSAALAGAAAGKEIHINFENISGNCLVNRLRLSY